MQYNFSNTETNRRGFKEILTDDIEKEIVAFLNINKKVMENKGKIIRNHQSSNKKSCNDAYPTVLLLFILFITSTTLFSQNEDNAVKMRLDSVIIDRNSYLIKIALLYDEHGNQILCTESHRDTAINDWNILCKSEYLYDSNKNMIAETVQNFSDFLIRNDFGYPLVKNEYAYDVNGNQIMHIYYHWNYKNDDWEVVDKSEYTYGSNGKLIKYISENCRGNFRDEFMYDTNGNKTEEVSYYRGDRYWEYGDRTKYTYDTNGNKTKEIEYQGNRKRKGWKKQHKTEFIYDIYGNNIKEIEYYVKNTAWKKRRITEYEYDNNRNLTKTIIGNERKIESIYNDNGKEVINITYSWNTATNDWLIDEKVEYVYDFNGNKIMRTWYEYDISSNSFTLGPPKEEYIYNLSYLVANLIIPHFPRHYSDLNRSDNINLLEEKKRYWWESNDCITKFYYSPHKSNNQITIKNVWKTKAK